MRQWTSSQDVEKNLHDLVGGLQEGQDRDVGIPNSTSYNPPPLIQESPVKLPLAPIVSSSQGYATVSTHRRGTAIFNPTQTLDHRRLLDPPPLQQPQAIEDNTRDPDPDPDQSTRTCDGPSDSKTPISPARPPPPASAANNTSSIVRYRECLKNHAASMGGHVVDGCGEFMPGGEEGTAEAMRCAACDCHRNFHRKEVDGEGQPSNYNPSSGNNYRSRAPLIHTLTPSSMAAAHQQQHHSKNTRSYSQAFAAGTTPPAMVSFGGAADESSSEDLNMFQSNGGGHAEMQPSFSGSKKRFRTKFSQEQKNRMQELAERLGWRIQKEEEEQVQRFCNETGVKRQVFKVWMHNNKQAMKKRQI